MKKEKPLLAKNIASLRKAKNWTQEKLAKESGYHINTIKELETGKSEGTQNSRQKIAEKLGVTVADLFTDLSAKPPKQKPDSTTHIELISGIIASLATLNDSQLGTVKSLIETIKDLPSTAELTTADIIRRFFPVVGDEKKHER